MSGLNYWWKRHQNIKTLLAKYMKDNKIKSVEDAIEDLLNKEYPKQSTIKPLPLKASFSLFLADFKASRSQ